MQSDEDYKIQMVWEYPETQISSVGKNFKWCKYQEYRNVRLDGRWQVLVVNEVPTIYFGIIYDRQYTIHKEVKKEIMRPRNDLFAYFRWLFSLEEKLYPETIWEMEVVDHVDKDQHDLVPEDDLQVSRLYYNDCGEINEG